jgi:hypothetical protein
MKHHKINAEEISRRLKIAVGKRAVSEVAKTAKIDVSRVSRFLNGDFKKLTPVLRQLCNSVGISLRETSPDPRGRDLSPELLAPLRRIVGRDPDKIHAATRLLRSMEALTLLRPRKTPRVKSKH